ncbi:MULTISPECIES: DUF3951 domain-containing protein [unclassified Bacillus (in: firmicutes)]|uniref:DUF3951 domain-containing protein n=1 Tax=unclassified Bacillus (in: firmicutes) TaxID=185979 RepID=UPI00232D13F4|nr:DUF3951 domain-containing protein [Bacillus sp. BP-3]MDC2865783.1 DUF3951 domain-containing protein [Bacillus sp. BP-3]
MFILGIAVVMFTMLLFVIIGLTTYKMLVQKVTPQIYYTPFDSISAQSRVEFHEEQGDREKRAEKDNNR